MTTNPDDILSQYGIGYQSPALGGDEIYDTSDVSRIAAHQTDAKERQRIEALKNLAITFMAPWATVGAKAAQRSAPLPSPQSESTVDTLARWGKAGGLHQRGEMKRDNPWGWPLGLGTFGASAAATLSGEPWMYPGISGLILTQPKSVLMEGHWIDTRNIARYLRGMQLREARKQPAPDNSGTTLYSGPAMLDQYRND